VSRDSVVVVTPTGCIGNRGIDREAFIDVLELFNHPDVQKTRKNLRMFADAVKIGVGDIPKFLLEYGPRLASTIATWVGANLLARVGALVAQLGNLKQAAIDVGSAIKGIFGKGDAVFGGATGASKSLGSALLGGLKTIATSPLVAFAAFELGRFIYTSIEGAIHEGFRNLVSKLQKWIADARRELDKGAKELDFETEEERQQFLKDFREGKIGIKPEEAASPETARKGAFIQLREIARDNARIQEVLDYREGVIEAREVALETARADLARIAQETADIESRAQTEIERLNQLAGAARKTQTVRS